MAKNIIVIGAGAAGLVAAISAARAGADVTVLEAQERPGRKLLVTGNGRCNLSNTSEHLAEQYRGTGAPLASKLIQRFDTTATLEFFHGLGLLTQEKNGYVYPHTAQSSSVLEVLLAELRRLKVKLKFSQDIVKIAVYETPEPVQAAFCRPDVPEPSAARFAVVTSTWTYHADAVILACGSKAAPATGASETGYLLVRTLGHTILEPRPALVPFTSNAPFLNRTAGVRCRAGVTLLRHALFCEPVARDIGELQWTAYGVSGIVIFQLSRYTAFEAERKIKKPDKTDKEEQTAYSLSIDFFPDCGEKELEELLIKRAAELERESVRVLLRGLLNEKLIPVILSQGKKLPQACGDLEPADIFRICHTMKAFPLPVTGTKSFDQAQICTGGVDCREITDELESRIHGGLYFAGEMLDVDGPCGDYNLQWAWTSGYLSGQYAARNHDDLKQAGRRPAAVHVRGADQRQKSICRDVSRNEQQRNHRKHHSSVPDL
ncbi:MAG: aminoacetone oxidase family FAD-binding enzyme [Clostridiales bacterium]|nr:aminoacetone oxidase family FAD-binding enzyme [Clostridiales bacterium]